MRCGLPERIRTFDLQSRSLTRYPAVPRVDIKFYHPIIAYLQEKSNPFLKKSRRRSPPFQPLLSDEKTLGGHLFSLWKTPPLPVDFSTKIPKSFPQVVEKSVDISAVLWKNPHKIRHFRGFSQLKSNFGGVDNYQMDIKRDRSFPQGKRMKRRKFRRFFADFDEGKRSGETAPFSRLPCGWITGNK